MRLLASAVCDHAAPSPNGKLDVRGIFHDLYATAFPAQQARMMLVLSLEWDAQDRGRYDFRVDVKGPGGAPTLSVDGYSEVTPRPTDRPPPRTRLVMPLENVVFPLPGRYDFEIKAKGQVMTGPTLYLIEVDDTEGAG